jgi:predicted nucleic acid-binding protein
LLRSRRGTRSAGGSSRTASSSSPEKPPAGSAQIGTPALIVLDASAAIDLLVGGPAGRWVEGELIRNEAAAAPELIDLEVVNALRRQTRVGRIPEETADAALKALPELRISRWSHVPLVPRIWALRAQLTPYDAAYVALAEQLDAELVTTDDRLARSHGHDARITTFPR